MRPGGAILWSSMAGVRQVVSESLQGASARGP